MTDRQASAIVGVIAALVVAGCAALATGPLDSFPNSADEQTYLWMSERILEGRLSIPAPAVPEAVTALWRTVDGDRWLGLYPPAWSALMAPATAAGAPWLANALLSALTLALVFALARRLYDDASTGLIAVVLLATNPMFLLNGASYFAHPFCLAFTTASLVLLATAMKRDRPLPWGVAVAAGLCAGLAGSMRPPAAVAAVLPMAIAALLVSRQRGRLGAGLAAGGLAGVLPLLLHNAWATGSPLRPAYTLFESKVALRADLAFDRLRVLAQHRHGLIDWVYDPLLLIVFAIALWLAPRPHRRRLVDVALVLTVPLVAAHLLLNPQTSEPGNQYGPRYAYPLLVPMALLLARVIRVWPPRRWLAATVVAAVAALQLASLASHADVHARQVRERTTLYRALEEAGTRDAVVFLATGIGLMDRRDLTRNSPRFDDPVAWALDRGPAANAVAIERMFAGRTPYLWRFRGSPGRGTLTRLDTATGLPAARPVEIEDGHLLSGLPRD